MVYGTNITNKQQLYNFETTPFKSATITHVRMNLMHDDIVWYMLSNSTFKSNNGRILELANFQ